MSHSPAASAVAGDPVTVTASVTTSCLAIECGDITVAVEYRDSYGDVKSITKVLPLEYFAMSASSSSTTSSPGSSTRSVSFELPGDVVRFPELTYRVKASQKSNNPLNPHEVVAFSPASGEHVVPVLPVTRVRVLRPDGTPMTGVDVLVSLARGGAVWQTSTNSQGWFSVALSLDDPRVEAAVQGVGRSINLFMDVFDTFPTEEPPEDGITLSGLGLHVATVVNLGHPALPATDPEVQDISFTAEEQTRKFFPGPSTSEPAASATPPPAPIPIDFWTCFGMAPDDFLVECIYEEFYFPQDVPAGHNVGAGWDTTTKYWYQTSVNTKTEWAVSGEAGWEKGKGSVGFGYYDEDIETTGAGAGPYGPNFNRRVWLTTEFVRRTTRFSRHIPGDSGVTWQESSKVVPYTWLGSLNRTTTTDWYHDEAVKGPDCILKVLEGGLKTVGGKSIRWAFDISAVVGVPRLKAGHVYVGGATSKEQASEHSYEWKATTSDRVYLESYVYVKGGRSVSDSPPRCAPKFPDRGWTHASNDDQLHL